MQAPDVFIDCDVTCKDESELLLLPMLLHVTGLSRVPGPSPDCAMDGECESCCGSFNFEDREFRVKRGDYSSLMQKVCHHLQQAEVCLFQCCN